MEERITIQQGNMDDAEYGAYLQRIQTRFLSNVGKTGPLFTTDAEGFWGVYLDSLPLDQRQFHACHACRTFIERFGALVLLNEVGRLSSAIWDEEAAVGFGKTPSPESPSGKYAVGRVPDACDDEITERVALEQKVLALGRENKTLRDERDEAIRALQNLRVSIERERVRWNHNECTWDKDFRALLCIMPNDWDWALAMADAMENNRKERIP